MVSLVLIGALPMRFWCVRHLEKQQRESLSFPEKGFVIDNIKGVTARGGIYKENEIAGAWQGGGSCSWCCAGASILHYRFVDQDGERYEVPCYVVIEPKNLL